MRDICPALEGNTDSGIQEIFAPKIWNPGIPSTTGIRNRESMLLKSTQTQGDLSMVGALRLQALRLSLGLRRIDISGLRKKIVGSRSESDYSNVTLDYFCRVMTSSVTAKETI